MVPGMWKIALDPAAAASLRPQEFSEGTGQAAKDSCISRTVRVRCPQCSSLQVSHRSSQSTVTFASEQSRRHSSESMIQSCDGRSSQGLAGRHDGGEERVWLSKRLHLDFSGETAVLISSSSLYRLRRRERPRRLLQSLKEPEDSEEDNGSRIVELLFILRMKEADRSDLRIRGFVQY
eukprot:2469252-Rhodomonas_salina.3